MTGLSFQCGSARYLACKTLGRLWPGVCFSPIAPAQLRTIGLPARLPAGWARVRVHQCGLCASDISLIRLAFAPSTSPVVLSSPPQDTIVLGHELVGTVIETTEGCTLRPGQRVISRSGGFRNCFNRNAEPCPACAQGDYALCRRQADPAPTHEPVRSGGFAAEYVDHGENLLAVPDSLDDDAATIAEPMATALRAVLALPEPTRTAGQLLIIGAGIQGLSAAHWASHLRPEFSIACTARHTFQAELAGKLGASHVFADGPDPAQLAAHLGTSTAPSTKRRTMLMDGFDAIIDTVGTPASLQNALDWTRPGGTVIILGTYLSSGRLDYSPIWFREVRVRGVYAHGMETFEDRHVPTLALALDLLASRARLPFPLVTHKLPLRDYRHAVHLARDKAHSKAVRVALLPDIPAHA